MSGELLIAFRIVHILSGAAWVGTVFLTTWFLERMAARLPPSEGSRFLNLFLDQRSFSIYISSVEVLAVATGLILYWNASGHFQAVWMTTPTGMAFGLGGLAAITALVISLPLSGTLGKLYRLGEKIAGGDESTHLTEFRRLHRRLARIGNADALLLVFTVAAMASAQYL